MEDQTQEEGAPEATPGRLLLGGGLMGFANLVPGISGGTMILAVGLYERFVDTLASASRLRLGREHLRFLAFFGLGAVVVVAGLSGLLVDLVASHRWVMYSLFLGMTLGGVPELAGRTRPLSGGSILSLLVGLAAMVGLTYFLRDLQIPSTPLALIGVGAVAASSMILPGISGSYLLLVFGLYETVIGSLSSRALREDPVACLWIIVPVGIGAVLGMGLLSNVLKRLLERRPRGTHAALMGLLLGSVLGLQPFQEPVHPELARKPVRKQVAVALEWDEVMGAYDEASLAREAGVPRERFAELIAENQGQSPGDLKRKSDALQSFSPTMLQVLSALGIFGLGFLVTRLVSRRAPG